MNEAIHNYIVDNYRYIDVLNRTRWIDPVLTLYSYIAFTINTHKDIKKRKINGTCVKEYQLNGMSK